MVNSVTKKGRTGKLPKQFKLLKLTDVTIHWKALEHFLMGPLVFRFVFRGRKNSLNMNIAMTPGHNQLMHLHLHISSTQPLMSHTFVFFVSCLSTSSSVTNQLKSSRRQKIPSNSVTSIHSNPLSLYTSPQDAS
jgi:hypothetical protein